MKKMSSTAGARRTARRPRRGLPRLFLCL